MGAWYSRERADSDTGEDSVMMMNHTQPINGELEPLDPAISSTSPPSSPPPPSPFFHPEDKSSSPGTYSFDTPFSSSGFRPPVWTGASNPDAGLLGFQAPAADGLDESHDNHETLSPRSGRPGHSWQLNRIVPKKRHARKKTPVLPAEVHIQILSHLAGPTKQPDECTFCRHFTLSRLALVSRLHHSIVESYLYPTLDLSCTTCPLHHHLSSPITQLTAALPLLLQTLSLRPDLASSINTLSLPPLKSFLTCTLEKTLLPTLLLLLPNLHHISGLDRLLDRQFFSGEHYCDDAPTQHGILSRTLQKECTSLQSWTWTGGNAGGRDWDARIWDHHPDSSGIGFAGFHARWCGLRELSVVDVWNVGAEDMAGIVRGLPCLRRLVLLAVRKMRVGRGDAGIVMAALEAVGEEVVDVVVGDLEDRALLVDVGRWVGGRGRNLKRLGVRRVPVTAEGVEEMLKGITKEEGLWGCASLVGCLEIEEDCGEEDDEVMAIGGGRYELRGLKDVVWRCHSVGLERVLRAGGMVDLRMLEVEQGQAEGIMAARQGLEVVRWKRT